MRLPLAAAPRAPAPRERIYRQSDNASAGRSRARALAAAAANCGCDGRRMRVARADSMARARGVCLAAWRATKVAPSGPRPPPRAEAPRSRLHLGRAEARRVTRREPRGEADARGGGAFCGVTAARGDIAALHVAGQPRRRGERRRTSTRDARACARARACSSRRFGALSSSSVPAPGTTFLITFYVYACCGRVRLGGTRRPPPRPVSVRDAVHSPRAPRTYCSSTRRRLGTNTSEPATTATNAPAGTSKLMTPSE